MAATPEEIESVRTAALHKITELILTDPAFVVSTIKQYGIASLPDNPTSEQLVEAVANAHKNKAFIGALYSVASQRFHNAGGWNNGGADPISAIAEAAGAIGQATAAAVTAKINQKTAVINAAANTKQKMIDFIMSREAGAKKDVAKVEDNVSKYKYWYIGGGIGFFAIVTLIVVVVLKNKQNDGGGQ